MKPLRPSSSQTRPLTPAERSALLATMGRAARLGKLGFAAGLVLLIGVVGYIAWMMPLLFKDGVQGGALAVLAFSGLTVALGAGYLLAIRRRVFASPEATVRASMPLAYLKGSFEPREVPDGQGFTETVFAMCGVAVAVPAHWPAIPPEGAALVFAEATPVAPRLIHTPPPKVIEIVGWRSLDADLRSGALRETALRYRTRVPTDSQTAKPDA